MTATTGMIGAKEAPPEEWVVKAEGPTLIKGDWKITIQESVVDISMEKGENSWGFQISYKQSAQALVRGFESEGNAKKAAYTLYLLLDQQWGVE